MDKSKTGSPALGIGDFPDLAISSLKEHGERRWSTWKIWHEEFKRVIYSSFL
jgi:hypothetical protein